MSERSGAERSEAERLEHLVSNSSTSSCSFGPLTYKRSNAERREMKKENDAKKDNKISSTDLSVVVSWISVLVFYAGMCYIHQVNVGLSTDD